MGGALVEPGRHAAAREVTEALLAVDVRVEEPALRARRRIEREHAPERRREVERAVDDERRRLEPRLLLRRELLAALADVEGPGDGERGHVLAADLVERSVLARVGVAAVGRPLAERARLALIHFARGVRGSGEREGERARDDARHRVLHFSGIRSLFAPSHWSKL
jgi:hypothetical protein